MARGALLVVHRRVAAVGATCAGVGGRACAARESRGFRAAWHEITELDGPHKKARDNEALRYRLEAGSLDTLGE